MIDDVRGWWKKNPMSYGESHGVPVYGNQTYEFGTREFFERLDETFYSWNRPLHGARPFDRLFPYEKYKGQRVLEIGCGMGTMIMNWARAGARVTAVDLNPFSIEQTRRRFALFGLEGAIEPMDARSLAFPDGAFDYVYSWGVLHHSPAWVQSVNEMMRVLRPGGGFGLMLYNRRSLLNLYLVRYIEGFLHRESRFLSPLELSSRYGDAAREEGNPHTWPVTADEMRAVLAPAARNTAIDVLGTDLDSLFRHLLPGLGMALPAWAKKPWARRWGWSLWAHGTKDAPCAASPA